MSVPEKAEPNQSFFNQKEEPLYSQAPQGGQSHPSTTVPSQSVPSPREEDQCYDPSSLELVSHPSKSVGKTGLRAKERVLYAENELDALEKGYTRLTSIMDSVPPFSGIDQFEGQKLFYNDAIARSAERFHSTDKKRLKGILDRMQAIADGDSATTASAREEFKQSPMGQKKLPQPQAPQKQYAAYYKQPAQTEDDPVQLIDYLWRRSFFLAELDFYTAAHDLYCDRDRAVNYIHRQRSRYERENHEGLLSFGAKFFATLLTRWTALDYIDRIDAMHLPSVPPRPTGEAGITQTLSYANKTLQALEQSRLKEIQTAFYNVAEKEPVPSFGQKEP